MILFLKYKLFRKVSIENDFRSACLRTEIFLRELTLSSTLNPNPKSSHSVDPQFSHKLLFIFTNFTIIFFIVQREPVSTFNKRPFCLGYFESCNFKRVKRKQHILTTILARERYRFPKSSVLALSL